MNKLRIPSIILLVLLAATFAFMIVMLILGEFRLFFIGGSVLVVELIIGFVIKGIHKRQLEEEKEEENV